MESGFLSYGLLGVGCDFVSCGMWTVSPQFRKGVQRRAGLRSWLQRRGGGEERGCEQWAVITMDVIGGCDKEAVIADCENSGCRLSPSQFRFAFRIFQWRRESVVNFYVLY